MKKNKRKIIVLASIISLFAISSVVFAAFIFTRIINGSAATGDVYKIDKKILNYANYAGKTDQEMEALELNTILANLSNRKLVAYEEPSDSVTCYATKRTGHADEAGEYNLPYLNQLGFKFSCTTSIDAYIRICFEDAWISKKTYNSGKTDESYIVKDQLNGVYEELDKEVVNASNFSAYFGVTAREPAAYSDSTPYYTKETIDGKEIYTYASISQADFDNPAEGVKYYTISTTKYKSFVSPDDDPKRKYFKFTAESPFKIKDDTEKGLYWYYDSATNIAYLKNRINVNELENEKKTIDVSFEIDHNYYYQQHQGSYHESVKITLSYFVDVVQANRVEAIWKLDPEKLV